MTTEMEQLAARLALEENDQRWVRSRLPAGSGSSQPMRPLKAGAIDAAVAFVAAAGASVTRGEVLFIRGVDGGIMPYLTQRYYYRQWLERHEGWSISAHIVFVGDSMEIKRLQDGQETVYEIEHSTSISRWAPERMLGAYAVVTDYRQRIVAIEILHADAITAMIEADRALGLDAEEDRDDVIAGGEDWALARAKRIVRGMAIHSTWALSAATSQVYVPSSIVAGGRRLRRRRGGSSGQRKQGKSDTGTIDLFRQEETDSADLPPMALDNEESPRNVSVPF